MAITIERKRFDEEDQEAFRHRLRESLEVLGRLLAEPGFGHGPRTMGAELECSLVGPDLAPFPANDRILARVGDPRWTVELDRFNVEANLNPIELADRPLGALAAQLEEVLAVLGEAAAEHGARLATVGILPTASVEDLQADALTDEMRYRALDHNIRRLRGGEPFRVDIRGRDHLRLRHDHVTLEGANTSFQLHLRLPPERFGEVFDAAQLATGPVLAVAANSPLLLGRRLWAETRLPLFRQAVEDRPPSQRDRLPRVGFGPGWLRGGVMELFREIVERYEPVLPQLGGEGSLTGDPPSLDELRLHASTVWWWNRPVYDPSLGGHLRLEMRVLPSGPSVEDMVANAALLLGLALGLAPRIPGLRQRLPFALARDDWERAARVGLDATLHWPDSAGRVVQRPAADLVLDLLPTAVDGLVGAGVAREEAERYLEVIAARVRTGRTGAGWQLAAFEALRGAGHPDPAAGTLDAYLDQSASGRGVHRWDLPAAP